MVDTCNILLHLFGFTQPMIDEREKPFYPMFAVKISAGESVRTGSDSDRIEAHVSAKKLGFSCQNEYRMARLIRSLSLPVLTRSPMKIALKYGIGVTLVIAAWVALKHFVLHLEGANAQFADIAVFNFTAIVGLMLGIKERRMANGDSLTFGEGFKTGISIAITYAILTSLYFCLLLAIVGPKLMQQEGETSYIKAFLGVSIGFALFGAIFSAIISLVVRK